MLTTKQRPERKAAEESEASRVVLPRFGVALFDDSRESGWASLPDGEAMRFNSPHDLRSDCIWVCSMEGGDFGQRWGRLHHMRSAEYVSKLRNIAGDFGVRVGTQGRFGGVAQKACALLSPTIHRSMVMATQVYGWTDLSSKLSQPSLQEALRVTLQERVAPPAVLTSMKAPLMSCYQTGSSPSWFNPFQSDRVTVTLRFNRLDYAKKILATRVPEGEWIFEGVEVNPGFRCSIEKALDPERPCIVNATVEHQGRDPDLAALTAFGSAPGKMGKNELRTWISQPELAWLSKFARINIHGIYYAVNSQELPVRVQLPEMLTSDPLFSLSVSAGLVAESHWKALAASTWKRNLGTWADPWAVWLRAVDRAMSFELAHEAHKAGFFVIYYGQGSVILTLARTDLPRLLDFAHEHEIAHPSFRTLFEENGLVA